MSTGDAYVRARVDTATKECVADALDGMSLSISDAIHLLIHHIAAEVVSLRRFFALSKDWPDELPVAGGDGLPIGRLLFSGAENEVERILNTEDGSADYDGKHWAGLHHPRIS